MSRNDLTNISANDYSKSFLLKAYISVHKFDIICLSETHLDSIVPLDDGNLVITGYNLICSDPPSNTKHRGVCLYFKNYLPLQIYLLLLKEYLNFEVRLAINLVIWVPFVDPQASLRTILKTFPIILNEARNSGAKRYFLMTIIVVFKTKSCNWYSHDKTSFEGT